MISSSEIIDIVEIVYFGPALLASIYICVKHGFSKEAGWFLLIILSLARLIGASTGIAALSDPTNSSLIACSLILSSIGSTILVATLTGIVNRIDSGSGQSRLSPRMRKMIQLAGLAAVVLSIIGGTKVASSDPESRSEGYTYTKAAIILVLVQFMASIAILAFSAINTGAILSEDRTLFFCVSVAAPFVLVRVIYSICAAFNPTSSTFSIRSGTTAALVVRAILGLAMEIIAVSLFIFGGFKAPKIRKGERAEESMPMNESQQPHKHGVVNGARYQPVHGH
ncbi:hypothetical protein PMZ80_010148 [Knufia obscura]|uniref:DUF7702 domain-containing protein n=2 Tax=Knufia TaxID=430999 RepID=A0AAN8EV56_9EURO|nr:hypothetical protein PMZ80_010148 [Knufia obscura]KAK5952888.1 hypothetical protein OHC33_006009 [Knufia fluminis]